MSTSKVVDRCPSCGVEHDHPVHECEACGSAVRYWCRKHSREIGWLPGDVCPRCPPTTPRPPRPVIAPPPPAAPTSAPSNIPTPATRPWLRFERKPVPAETQAPPPVLAAPGSTEPAAPPPAATPSEPARACRQRRGMGVRLFEAVLTVLQTGIAGVLVGVVAGGIAAYRAGAEVPLEAAIGGAKGGMAGLALGVLIAIAFFHRSAYPPETDG